MSSVDRQTTKFQVIQGTGGQALAGAPFFNQQPVAGNTGTGAGSTFNGDGMNGSVVMQIQELNVGAATVQLQGSFDGTTWYAVGYYQVDGNATLTRAVVNIAVAQNTSHVYQLLDDYPLYRANISANTGSVYVSAYGVPV